MRFAEAVRLANGHPSFGARTHSRQLSLSPYAMSRHRSYRINVSLHTPKNSQPLPTLSLVTSNDRAKSFPFPPKAYTPHLLPTSVTVIEPGLKASACPLVRTNPNHVCLPPPSLYLNSNFVFTMIFNLPIDVYTLSNQQYRRAGGEWLYKSSV